MCRVLDCENPTHARGLCNPHYLKARRGEDVGLGPGMFGVFGRTVCVADGCDRSPMGGGYWCGPCFTAWVDEQNAANPDRLASRRSKVACGTSDGRARHKRRGEPLCPRCKASGSDWLTRMAAV